MLWKFVLSSIKLGTDVGHCTGLILPEFLLITSRTQLMMFLLSKSWTRNWVKFECRGGKISWHPAVHHICMWLRSTVCLRAGVCERSLQMWWKWVPRPPLLLREWGEFCVAGACVGSGARSQHWLCDRAALDCWRTHGTQGSELAPCREVWKLYQPLWHQLFWSGVLQGVELVNFHICPSSLC